MDEYLERQKSVLRQLINEYRAGRLHLDTLIQRIEGVSEAIAAESWKEAVFPIVLTLEQVNAAAIDMNADITEADRYEVTSALCDLEALIDHLTNE